MKKIVNILLTFLTVFTILCLTSVDGAAQSYWDAPTITVCNKCDGNRYCYPCNGTGSYMGDPCTMCSGTGVCYYCNGTGRL